MRWPFSRRGNESPAPEPAAEPRPQAPVQRKAEWATLPPIQRAAADPIELTAESGLFVENLASRSSIEPALAPLGHDVTMEAPAGIASGIARPIEHRSDGPALQHRLHPAPAPAAAARAQRAPLFSPAAAPVAVAPTPDPEPAVAVPAAPEVAHAEEPEQPSAPAPEPTPAPEQLSAPAPTLPAVPVAETSAAPAGLAPGLPAARAPLVHRTPPTPAATTPPAAAPGPVQRAAAAEPPAPAPAEAVQRHAGHDHEEEAATMPAAEARAPVQRAAEDAVEAAPVEAAPVEAAPVEAARVEAAPVEAGSQSPAPEAPVQRAGEEDEAPEAAAEEEAATSPEPGVQRAAEEPEPSAPTVGTRPVVTATLFRSSLGPVPQTVGLQRSEPLPFAVQRAPGEAAASSPAAGLAGQPSLAASAPVAPGTPPGGAQRAQSDAPPAPGLFQRSASSLPGRAPRAADVQQPGIPPAATPPLQRAPETAPPGSTQRPAPSVGERPLGLGAPFRPAEAPAGGPGLQRREAIPGSPVPAPQSSLPPTFRRTRSSLAAQRAPEAGPGAAAPGPAAPSPVAPTPAEPAPAEPSPLAPSPESSSAPLVGDGPALAEPPDLPSSAQRAPADSPSEPLPPLAGLGAPSSIQRAAEETPPPAEVLVQRSEDASPPAAAPLTGGLDAFIAGVAQLQAGRVPDAMAGAAPEAAPRPPTPASPYTGPLAPRLDLPHRRRESAPRSSASASAGPAAATALAVQRSPEPQAPAQPAVQAVPVVGQRPLRVQRSAEDVPAPVRSHVERQIATPIGDVKVHRSPETATVARQIKAKAFTTGGEIHMPADHGPLDREPARSLVAHELVHVAQQRQLGASLPTEDSRQGQALERQAQSVEASSAAQPSAPLVLARKPDPAAIAETAAEIAVQRVESGQSSPGWPGSPPAAPVTVSSDGGSVQRSPEIGEVTSVAPHAFASSSPIQRASAGDPLSGIPQAGTKGDTELGEEQLRQAWNYVRSRLSEELADDRERAGMSIDIF